MAIKNIHPDIIGNVGVVPSIICIETDDTVAEVTTAGYLTQAEQMGASLSPQQAALVYTTDSGPKWFKVTVAAGVYSLVAM